MLAPTAVSQPRWTPPSPNALPLPEKQAFSFIDKIKNHCVVFDFVY
jgi:hypothetical protein